MQNTAYVFNLHNLNFKEVFQLLQEEKAFQFTKPKGGKIQSDTKSDFITVCVAMNNRYEKMINTRKERKALLTVEGGSGGIGLTAWHKGGSKGWSAWGMSIHMSGINLSPKQHDCEGEGKWQHGVYQNKKQWERAWWRPGMFLWKLVTSVAVRLDAKLCRKYFLASLFVLKMGSSATSCFFELNFLQGKGKWQ